MYMAQTANNLAALGRGEVNVSFEKNGGIG